jgi:hypothetical protein
VPVALRSTQSREEWWRTAGAFAAAGLPLQAGQELKGYPALVDEDETEETLVATPEAKVEKKPKSGQEPSA